MYGYNPTRNNINIVSGRTGNYQPMIAYDQVLNQNGVGLDLNNQGAQRGFSSCPAVSQFAPRPKVEWNSIDFSQWRTPILSSLGNNLN